MARSVGCKLESISEREFRRVACRAAANCMTRPISRSSNAERPAGGLGRQSCLCPWVGVASCIVSNWFAASRYSPGGHKSPVDRGDEQRTMAAADSACGSLSGSAAQSGKLSFCDCESQTKLLENGPESPRTASLPQSNTDAAGIQRVGPPAVQADIPCAPRSSALVSPQQPAAAKRIPNNTQLCTALASHRQASSCARIKVFDARHCNLRQNMANKLLIDADRRVWQGQWHDSSS
jgi:hypothetical protein